jgi:uncharacterized protein (DUF952 family)
MSHDLEPGRRLFHLALRDQWDEAVREGAYRQSTIGRSLDDVGYIHASFAEQAQGVADGFYRGRDDVVVLVIDPGLLDVDIRVEEVPGTGQSFPHIYGPLPVAAVVSAEPVALTADGTLDLAPHLAG